MSKNIWLTSDWHFSHPNILTLNNRPFDTISNMEKTILENTNKVVKKEDTLIFVGDICLGQKNKWVEILDTLICQNLILVQGNHDTWKNVPKDRFVCISHSINLKVFNHHFLVCHFPYRASWWKFWLHPSVRKDPRRPKDNGLWLLQGHDHRSTPFCSYHPRMLSIGVDCWGYKPVNMSQIMSMIQRQEK